MAGKEDIFLSEDDINQPPASAKQLNNEDMFANSASKLHQTQKKPIKKRNLLSITSKTNSIQKFGKPLNREEHMRRILTRENTPCAKYQLNPVFINKKEINAKELNTYFVNNINIYIYIDNLFIRLIIDHFFKVT